MVSHSASVNGHSLDLELFFLQNQIKDKDEKERLLRIAILVLQEERRGEDKGLTSSPIKKNKTLKLI